MFSTRSNIFTMVESGEEKLKHFYNGREWRGETEKVIIIIIIIITSR